MRQAIVGFMAAVLLSLGGCYMPVGADPKTASDAPSAQATSEHTGLSDASGGASLTVYGESIKAAEIATELRDELSVKRRELSPGDYYAYVQQRAARWINDRLADALVYHQASLRFPPEADGRIDAYVDSEIRNRVTAEYDGVQRRYERYLESNGQTLEDARAKLKREIIISAYLESDVRPKIAEPTRADLWTVFEANREAWRKPPRRSMSLIDVRVIDHLPEGVNEPTREQLATARRAARAIIEESLARIEKGEEFAEVARDHSDGLHASHGGAWGWVKPDGVRARFEPAVTALYGLNAGEVSKVIEAEDGFFLVRCDEVDPGVDPSFEDVQPELKNRHFVMEYNRILGEQVAELRKRAQFDAADLDSFHADVVRVAMNLQPAATP